MYENIIAFTIFIIIILTALYYIKYMKNNNIIYGLEKYHKNNNATLELINDEIILDNSFMKHNTIYKLVKRNRLTLPNESNTIIISWHMHLPNIGGEFYWTNNYTKDKPIIRIGKSPHIYYNVKENKLKIICNYQYSPFANQYPIIEVPDIDLQRWSVYTILIQNTHVKVYINGELVISRKLDKAIEIDDYKSSEITIGEINNNLLGKINNMKLYFKELTHAELSNFNL